MRYGGVLLTLALFMICASSASAVEVRGDVTPRIKRYVRESLLPSPPVVVNVRLDYCPVEGAWGCWEAATSTLYVADDYDREGFLHELGHVFDDHMSPAVRWAFASIAGLPPVPWFPESQEEYLSSTGVILGEWFADAYSMCARHRTIRRRDQSRDTHEWAPTPRQHAATCRLLRREVERQGWP